MEAAISEIEGCDLDPATKRQLRLLLVNKPHLLVACVPGDVVQTLQEALQEGMLSSLLAAYMRCCSFMHQLSVASSACTC